MSWKSLLAALGLSFVATGAALAGNFEFVVPGPPGLDLTILGYARDGSELFSKRPLSPEQRAMGPAYVIRVDDTILKKSGLSAWCVLDPDGKLDGLLSIDANVVTCDDKPSETQGSYRFTARTTRTLVVAEPPAAEATAEPEAPAVAATAPVEMPALPKGPVVPQKILVACVQSELNWRGYDTGRPDGAMGNKTRAGAEAFLAATDTDLPALSDDTLSAWCTALAQHEPRQVRVELRGDSGVFGADLDGMVEAAGKAVIKAFGISPREDMTFFVSDDAEWLTDNKLKVNGLGKSYRANTLDSFRKCDPIAGFAYRSVFVCTNSDIWDRGRQFAQTVLGHEFFHALSSDLAGDLGKKACCYDLSRIGPLGPEWFKEGAAQYAGMVALAELGQSNLDADIARVLDEVAGLDPDLKARTSRNGYNKMPRSSLIGVAASALLVDLAGRQSLVNYYRYLGYGAGPDAAFSAAFGMTEADFQPKFTAFLAAHG